MTITITTINETFREVSPEMLKRLQKEYGKKNVKIEKNFASQAKKCYDTRYNIEVTYIEDRQNGYTLVYSTERGQYFANTVQIEFR